MSLISLIMVFNSFQIGLPEICYEAQDLPDATAEALPRWRGFNLLEKFILGWDISGPFHEKDFQLISELGFNFVRLPMDYRFWIVDGDWERIDEEAFADLDQALEFGAKYRIHVCMNFHRAPGHTVASPPEATSLWKDEETQRICALHWQFFAKRYKGVPNRLLSFNLFNEPHGISGKIYADVVMKMAEAIWAEDPDRLIIADGLWWGVAPCNELIPMRIAQATRGYQPMGITHYQASWVAGADRYPVPEWPVRSTGGGYLYGPEKEKNKSPLEIRTTFDEPRTLVLTIGEVSGHARFAARLDGDDISSADFTPGPGEGPWKESTFREEYNSYQGRYDQEISIPVPAGAHTIVLDNTEGDWLTITRLALQNEYGEYDHLGIIPKWEDPNLPITIDPETGRFRTAVEQNADWLWEKYFARWSELREQGKGVMAGEWGTFSKTPHDVTLRWMEDSLKTFQRAGLGWALWNFRGSFGILDSGREDVAYEPFHGHQLDRKMLELLQKY